MKSSGIGGQAVLEGVMMKNKEKYAVAVRKPDKEIAVEVSEYHAIGERIPFFRLPILRGVVVFVESLVIGMKTLTYSAEFFEDEEDTKENKKKSKAASEDKKSARDQAAKEKPEEKVEEVKKPQTAAMAATVVVSILLAVGIFMLLPYFISQLLNRVIPSQSVLTLIEGIVRILIFVGYVAAISRIQDIKRVFMYHGAEHKTINCLEHGLELTVDNVRKQPKYHKRCGTSFLLIVMFVSVILFMFIRVPSPVLRLVLRLLLVPVIAGISYELIRFAGNSEDSVGEIMSGSGSKIIKIFKVIRYVVVMLFSRPGKWLQSMTTREPEDSMIEVAIASVDAVFDWKAYLAEEAETVQKLSIEPNSENLENKKTFADSRIQEEQEREVKRQAVKERAGSGSRKRQRPVPSQDTKKNSNPVPEDPLENELKYLDELLKNSASEKSSETPVSDEKPESLVSEKGSQTSTVKKDSEIPASESKTKLEELPESHMEELAVAEETTKDSVGTSDSSEEDDEVLKALDKFFVYEAEPEDKDSKKGTIRF